MSKHTKGPWTWWSKNNGRPAKYDLCKLHGLNGHQIFSAYGGDGCRALGRDVEAMANARLIAAAPDLLEALKSMLEGAEEMGGTTSRAAAHNAKVASARVAVAKAEGEDK